MNMQAMLKQAQKLQKDMIETQKINAEFAVASTGDNFSQMFAAMDDAYMQARSADVKDISNRIINCLSSDVKNNEMEDEKSLPFFVFLTYFIYFCIKIYFHG